MNVKPRFCFQGSTRSGIYPRPQNHETEGCVVDRAVQQPVGVMRACDQNQPAGLGSVERGEHRPHCTRQLILQETGAFGIEDPKMPDVSISLRDTRILHVFSYVISLAF